MLQAAIDPIRSALRTLPQLVATLPCAAGDLEESGALRLSGPTAREVTPAERAFRRMLLTIVDRNLVAAGYYPS